MQSLVSTAREIGKFGDILWTQTIPCEETPVSDFFANIFSYFAPIPETQSSNQEDGFYLNAIVTPQEPFAYDLNPIGVRVNMVYPLPCGSTQQTNRILLKWDSKNLDNTEMGICSFNRGRDEHSFAEILSVNINQINYQLKVFGLFEGIYRPNIAEFLNTHLLSHLQTAIEANNPLELTENGVCDSLKACFSSLSDTLLSDPNIKDKTKSTASVAVLFDDKIWFANVGQSRIVLQDNGKVILCTKDNPTDTISKQKVNPQIIFHSLFPQAKKSSNRHFILCSRKVFKKLEGNYYTLTTERICDVAFRLQQNKRPIKEIAAILAALPLPYFVIAGELAVMIVKV